MSITTADEYLRLLQRSRLLDKKQFAQAQDLAGQSDDPLELARDLIREQLLTRWQAAQLLAGRTSFHLGKYKLIDLLGAGGMGRVFVAEHTTMNRPVALKIIPKQLGQDPASLEQFFREARAIAALNHPNIVHAYDVDRENDRYYMVMEYIEGQDLQRMVQGQGPLKPEQAADYIRQAADGLAHAHSRDMIHCDVKPANLLVNKQGVVKILDLGVARLVKRHGDDEGEKEERTVGTVDYMAPEQAIESPELDHRADIYSLGCTFYFLLTGRPPFPEGTLPERILKHQTAQPREISRLRPDVPENLALVCAKMMAKRPEDRFQSADEVSRVLSEGHPSEQAPEQAVAVTVSQSSGAAAATPTQSGRSTAGGLAADWRRAKAVIQTRRKVILAGLGGIVALVVVVALALLVSGLASGPEETSAPLAASDTPAAPEQEPPKKVEPSPPAKKKPAEPEDDADAWPELPDYGNLTSFDPEAVAKKAPGGAVSSGGKPKTKSGSSQKPGPQKPSPEKPAPDKPDAAKAKPDQPEKQPKPPAKTPSGQGPSEKPAPAQPESKKPEPDQPESEKPQANKEPPEKKAPAEKQPPKEPPEKAPAEKQPPKEQPEEKQPKKAQPKKPVDPLGEFPDSIDLPELLAKASPEDPPAGPFMLGKVHSGADVGWQLYLLGGQTAFKRNRSFVLEQEERDPARARWQVQLETASASREPSREPVARIWRDEDRLMFQWAKEAAAASANYLRNCILQVRVEAKTKYQTLTSPVEAEPIDVDLERGTVNASVPVKWLPDAGSLRVEITKVEGREGHSVSPPEPAEPRKPLELRFDRTDRHGNTAGGVSFRLTFTARPAAMAVKLQLVEPPPTAFRGLKMVAAGRRNQIENMRDRLEQELNPKDKNKAPRGEQRSFLMKQIDTLESQMWYIDFYNEVQGKAKIHFRVFTEVDGRQVVLAST